MRRASRSWSAIWVMRVAVTVLGATLVEAAPFVSITSPTPGQRLAAAPDYATEVLGDPWDMNNRDDYSRYEPGENLGFSSLGLDGQGHLVGVFSALDSTIGMLYRDFSDSIAVVGAGGGSRSIHTATRSSPSSSR